MQAGGDTNRLFQEGRALAEGMGEQDKWDEFTKDYARPARTVNHIVDEQKSDYLLTKQAVEKGQDYIKELQDGVSETSKSLKRASSPSSIASLSASLSDFSTRLQEAQKSQEAHEAKLEGLKKWEENPEEALKTHHQDLVKTFYEMKAKQLSTAPAPENGTALDEFNTRANIMGDAAHDAQVIQEAHPEWFEGAKPLLPETTTEPLTRQIHQESAASPEQIKSLEDQMQTLQEKTFRSWLTRPVSDTPGPKPTPADFEKAIVQWADDQRVKKGDLFATESEMAGWHDDPTGYFSGNDFKDIKPYLQRMGFDADHWTYQKGSGFVPNPEIPSGYRSKWRSSVEKATKDLKKLKIQHRYLTDKSFGEIHQLSNGNKVLFLGEAAREYLKRISPRQQNWRGVYMPSGWVNEKLLPTLERSTDPYKDSIISLLKKAQNPTGSIIISDYGDPKLPFNERVKGGMSTLIEELGHNWQDTIGGKTGRIYEGPNLTSEQLEDLRRSVGARPGTENVRTLYAITAVQKEMENGLSFEEAMSKESSPSLIKEVGGTSRLYFKRPHLEKEDLDEMFDTIPGKGKAGKMWKYLNEHAYSKDRNTRVLESTAKLISDKASRFGMTPEEASNYLGKYFEKIKKQHGDGAIDRLFEMLQAVQDLHGGEDSGTIGRIKEILNGKQEPKTVPVEEPNSGPVQGVAGGEAPGGTETEGAGTQGPIKPPGPPEGLTAIPPEDLEGYVGKNQPTWEEGPRHPKLPDDMEEMVEKSKGSVLLE